MIISWTRKTPESDAMKRLKEYHKKPGFIPYFFIFFDLILFILVATQSIHLAVVTSESMRPYVNKGDLVIVEKLDKNFSIGDIIEIQPHGYTGTYIHRVVRKLSKNTYRTKGDNWKWEDSWVVTPDIVKGKVITINHKALVLPRLGIYLTPTKNVALSQDPLYNLIVNFIYVFRSKMAFPIIIILIFLIIKS